MTTNADYVLGKVDDVYVLFDKERNQRMHRFETVSEFTRRYPVSVFAQGHKLNLRADTIPTERQHELMIGYSQNQMIFARIGESYALFEGGERPTTFLTYRHFADLARLDPTFLARIRTHPVLGYNLPANEQAGLENILEKPVDALFKTADAK